MKKLDNWAKHSNLCLSHFMLLQLPTGVWQRSVLGSVLFSLLYISSPPSVCSEVETKYTKMILCYLHMAETKQTKITSWRSQECMLNQSNSILAQFLRKIQILSVDNLMICSNLVTQDLSPPPVVAHIYSRTDTDHASSATYPVLFSLKPSVFFCSVFFSFFLFFFFWLLCDILGILLNTFAFGTTDDKNPIF